jgi:hypothetical protein
MRLATEGSAPSTTSVTTMPGLRSAAEPFWPLSRTSVNCVTLSDFVVAPVVMSTVLPLMAAIELVTGSGSYRAFFVSAAFACAAR